MANIRMSKVPIGSKIDTLDSGSLGLVMSSKPSHKNNNLSKKEIMALMPKQATSLMCDDQGSRKASPGGILKPSKYCQRDQSEGSSQAIRKDNVRQLC